MCVPDSEKREAKQRRKRTRHNGEPAVKAKPLCTTDCWAWDQGQPAYIDTRNLIGITMRLTQKWHWLRIEREHRKEYNEMEWSELSKQWTKAKISQRESKGCVPFRHQVYSLSTGMFMIIFVHSLISAWSFPFTSPRQTSPENVCAAPLLWFCWLWTTFHMVLRWDLSIAHVFVHCVGFQTRSLSLDSIVSFVLFMASHSLFFCSAFIACGNPHV